MTYAFQFQFIFKIRIFTFFNFSIFTEFSLRLHKLGFFRFLHRLFRNISTKILLLLGLFSFVIYSNIFVFFLLSAFLPITKITFVLFHGFREHCKHKLFSHDDSRCCLVIYILAILCFPPDILSQEFDSMI